ncbi:hypothetical protein [Halovivax limisalsi]|nr:hypothetical protein [Halovivax limisalsi]
MNETRSEKNRSSLTVVAVAATVFGAMVVGLGLLLVPQSPLGGG